MQIFAMLWAFKEFLNPEFLQAIFQLIVKGILFAQSNFYNEPGEVQKQKCLDFINQSYYIIDLQFKFPDEFDQFIKTVFIPFFIDGVVFLMKNTGLMPEFEIKKIDTVEKIEVK